MGELCSADLQERIEAHVASGYSRQEAARHLGVSPSSAVKLVQWVAATGSVGQPASADRLTAASWHRT